MRQQTQTVDMHAGVAATLPDLVAVVAFRLRLFLSFNGTDALIKG